MVWETSGIGAVIGEPVDPRIYEADDRQWQDLVLATLHEEGFDTERTFAGFVMRLRARDDTPSSPLR